MSRTAGERLEAFARALDRVRVDDLLAFAASPFDEDALYRARAEAETAARRTGRGPSIAEAGGRVEAYVLTLFNASTLQPGWMEANWGRPGSAADRAQLARSLRDAVTAISLEDVLTDGAAAALIGPWAALLEPGAWSGG